MPPLPVDQVEGDSRAGTAETVVVTLGEEPTRALLQEVPAVYRTQVNDVLLTALAQAYVRWSGQGSLLVDLEGHGREELFDDVDLSRTVGWFTTLYPVLLHVPAGSGPGQALQAVKEQLRGVPNRGLGYGLLRYLSGDEELRQRLGELPGAGVCFNYLGQVDRGLPVGVGLTLAGESIGPSQSRVGVASPPAGGQRRGGRRAAADGLDLQPGPTPSVNRGATGTRFGGSLAGDHRPLSRCRPKRVHPC